MHLIPAPDRSVKELNFSLRVYNCLKRANIYTVGDLCKLTEQELHSMRNFGHKSAEAVIERLRKLGIVMRSELQEL